MFAENIVPHFEEDEINVIPVTDAIRAELATMPADVRLVVMQDFQDMYTYCETQAAWHRFLADWEGFGKRLDP